MLLRVIHFLKNMERMDPDIIEKREEFREHLTLGVVKALEKVPMVQDVVLAEHQPSDTIAITSWEQRYSTMLPPPRNSVVPL